MMKVKKKDGILYLIPDTDLVADKFDELRDFFLSELKKNDKEKDVVLDASNINVVDSLGVNLIIGLYRELDNVQKNFKVINANEKFMKIAHFFKFPAIFPIEGAEAYKMIDDQSLFESSVW